MDFLCTLPKKYDLLPLFNISNELLKTKYNIKHVECNPTIEQILVLKKYNIQRLTNKRIEVVRILFENLLIKYNFTEQEIVLLISFILDYRNQFIKLELLLNKTIIHLSNVFFNLPKKSIHYMIYLSDILSPFKNTINCIFSYIECITDDILENLLLKFYDILYYIPTKFLSEYLTRIPNNKSGNKYNTILEIIKNGNSHELIKILIVNYSQYNNEEKEFLGYIFRKFNYDFEDQIK